MVYLQIGEELLSSGHGSMVQVLQERKKRLGQEHPYTLLAILNLARLKGALN
jgi:hypothetical protein